MKIPSSLCSLRNFFVLIFLFVSVCSASAQVLETPSLQSFPELFENFHATIVVGETAPASDVVAATIIANVLQNTATVETITAKGFEDVFRKSIISAGDACNNPVTEDLIGAIDNCESAIQNNTAIIKIIALPFSDRYAMVVAGSTEELTRLAANVLGKC